MDVALIQWPREEPRRSQMAARRRPRLLLVAKTAAPPMTIDLLEDWIRLPAPDADVRARVRSLEMRIAEHRSAIPSLDPHGILRFGAESVDLSPLQARLVDQLTGDFGAVVSREQMARAGWPDSRPNRNTVDVHMARLRSRLATIGLRLRTVRSRGFILQVADDTD